MILEHDLTRIEWGMYLPFTRRGYCVVWDCEGRQQALIAVDWRKGKGWRFHFGWNCDGPRVRKDNEPKLTEYVSLAETD